jgi:hypothetical protein
MPIEQATPRLSRIGVLEFGLSYREEALGWGVGP